MAFYGEDTDPQLLLNEVKKIFQAPAAPDAAQSAEPTSTTGYKVPIHDGWHNLGGFNSTMKRYDDDPNASKGRGHFGVDMGAPAGTPIYALADGVVNTVSTDKMGGNIVGIKHANDIWSYYAHLSTAKVHMGDKVTQDTIIGTVGNTGNAGNPSNPLISQEGGRTWPHLHFGVKERGSWVDPAKFFSIPAYDPAYGRNPGKYQKFWLSDEAKQEATNFNMQQHNSNRRAAFTSQTDQLLKLAYQFYKLAVG